MRSARATRWLAFAAGLLFSACMILAFAPFSLWGFSLVALAPLVWLVEQARPLAPSPRRSFGRRGEGWGEGRSARDSDSSTPPTPPSPRSSEPERVEGAGPVAHARGSLPRGSFLIAAFAAAGTIPFHLFEHWWLWPVAGPGVPFVVLILCLYPLAFMWIMLRLRARWPRVPVLIAAPVLWAGLEFFRGAVAFDGYPWYFVGHPLIDFPWLARSATALGAMGVSAFAAANGALLGGLIARPRPDRALAVLGSLVGLAMLVQIVGWPSRATEASDRPIDSFLRVGVVQTNLAQSNKMEWPPAQRIEDLRWFLDLTEEAARSGPPDLIVWPETMFPGGTLDEQSRRAEREAGVYWNVDHPDGTRERVPLVDVSQALLDYQRSIGIPLVVGAIARENLRYEPGGAGGVQDHLYNSVYAIHDGGVIGRYDKVHLTPFGEVMPYISAWPWLERQMLSMAAAGMSFDLSASTRPRVLSVPVSLPRKDRGDSDWRRAFTHFNVVQVATPICFESTDAALCRRLINLGDGGGPRRVPVIFVNATNDGWFGQSLAGREQHLQLARWRALENGVPMVRAANTGISCVIDHNGRVIARGVRSPGDRPGHRGAAALTDGVLVVEVPLPVARTVYTYLGDWLGWGLMWGALAAAVGAWWPSGRRPRLDTNQGDSESPPPQNR